MLGWQSGFDELTGDGTIIMLEFRCKNLTLNISDCVSMCLSDETLKAVGPIYLVAGVCQAQGK